MREPSPGYVENLLRFLHHGLSFGLNTAAQLQPALYRKYEALERHIGHTLSPSRALAPPHEYRYNVTRQSLGSYGLPHPRRGEVYPFAVDL